MSCTALEVSGTCTDQDFIFTNYTLTASPAYAAVRVHDDRAALNKGVDQPFLQCLKINGLTCRNDKETNLFCNMSAL